MVSRCIGNLWTLKKISVIISFAANAQPGSFDNEPQDVPVDEGIILFAAAGAAFGYKKLKK